MQRSFKIAYNIILPSKGSRNISNMIRPQNYYQWISVSCISCCNLFL